MNWIKIEKEEFDELVKKSKGKHVIRFASPSITFYWDEEGIKHSDRSFGKYSFLRKFNNSELPVEYGGGEDEYFKLRE